MVALSFSIPEHRSMLLDGRKDQTIRLFSEQRYQQIAKANNLEVYWKQRSSESEKLFDAERTEIFQIYLYMDGIRPAVKKEPFMMHQAGWPWRAKADGTYEHKLTLDQVLELVRRDGFESLRQLYDTLGKMHRDKIFTERFFVTRFARKVA